MALGAAAIIAVITLSLMFVFSRFGGAWWSGSFSASNFSRHIRNDGINVSARSLNGHIQTNIDFDNAEALANIHTESTNASGEAMLILTQGNTERAFDISGQFNGNLDMSGFETGRIRFRFEFQNAQDVEIHINW
ncbi:MAG: hypothetical protein FWD01_02040 [Defluviitaleaceae bacterium]|nr:hypothetical protein [Defluviitaleaceae bacterium]